MAIVVNHLISVLPAARVRLLCGQRHLVAVLVIAPRAAATSTTSIDDGHILSKVIRNYI